MKSRPNINLRHFISRGRLSPAAEAATCVGAQFHKPPMRAADKLPLMSGQQQAPTVASWALEKKRAWLFARRARPRFHRVGARP